ncbi:MAG: VOC family protein [Myxococcota bacterium]|nr:VOC family protein [Myxococcota bacterium]
MSRRNVRFSHVGFHVRDLDTMVDFYTRHLGLRVTDRGALKALPGSPRICFLSADPTEHHQIALVEGRTDEKGMLNQVSFHADSLQELRDLDAELGEAGVAVKFGLNHGNAWSLYFADPEGNLIECFVQSPWHTRQPVTDPLDLSLSDDEIRERTQAVYASDPDFQPIEQWRAAFAKRLAEPG